MILVELNGGIGNQMFQYAAAKSLALHHKTNLKLDITPAADKTMPDELQPRPFELYHFNITDPVADLADINSFRIRSTVHKISEKVKLNYKRKIYREPFFHYDNNFYKAGPDVYLKGLWQSEKYFQEFKKEISSRFQFKPDVINNLSEITRKIKQQNGVALHVRRGDYLAKISQEILGSLPVEY